MEPAGEEEVLRPQPRLLYPGLQGVSGCLRDLELHWELRLVLHDDRACRYLISMAYVSNLEGDEVASTQLAVDTQVKECEFTHSTLHLEAHPQRPDVFHLEGRLLPDDLALVPRLATTGSLRFP